MRDNQKHIFVSGAKYIYRKFPLEGRQIAGTDILLAGSDIFKFLGCAQEVIIFAATLGFDADRQIAHAQKVSISQALDLDKTANWAIDEVCDNLQAEISEKFNIAKRRFSCGFGDLSVDIQPKILKALDATKTIGLYCNENNLMIPTKSVTAFMGVLR